VPQKITRSSSRLQERIDRLGPQPERGTRRERVALRHQAGRLAVARQQLASEAALANACLADEQHEPEVALPGAAQLVFERRELFAAPNQFGGGSRRRPPRLHQGADRCAHNVWTDGVPVA
jgi:hypothetical protein